MMKICIQCGKEFEPHHGLETLCSDECRYQRHQKRYRLHYREKKAPLKAKICPVCGREFVGATLCRKICSDACKKIRRAQLDAKYYQRHKHTRSHHALTPIQRITIYFDYLTRLEKTYGALPNGIIRRMILDWRDNNDN